MLPNTVSNKHRPDCHSSNTTIRHRSSSCGNSEKDTDISYCDFTNNDQTQSALVSRQCCVESDAEQYFVNNLSRKTSSSSHVAPSDLISYGSCNSLNYRSRTSLNSSCSAHNHHHHHHKTVRRNKCPHHHHRRKHSTSCVLLGSKRTSRSTSVQGSSSSIYEPLQGDESSFSIANMVLTPSKITIEHSETGDKTFPQNVPNDPDYISSPIKWNFVCNGDGSGNKTEYIEVAAQPSSSSKNDGINRQKTSDMKTVSIWRTDNEESNAIIFHHESEIVENCCENYFNCNYQHDDDDQQSMRTHQHCNNFKTNNHEVPQSTERLNNTVEIISSHSAPLDILNRNNISSVINQLNLSPEFRHYEKMTNLSQQNSANLTPCRLTRINQNFNLLNQNMENNNFNEDKFINTSRNATNQPQPHSSNEINVAFSSHQPNTSSMLRNLELFNITTPSTVRRGKPIGINLTTQNQFPTSQNRRSLHSNGYSSEPHSNSLLNVSNTSREITDRWQQVTNTIGLSGLAKIVRKRARKCAEFIKGDK